MVFIGVVDGFAGFLSLRVCVPDEVGFWLE
jgi:hypothetical protein